MWNSEMRIRVKRNDEDALYGNWKIHVKVIEKEHACTKWFAFAQYATVFVLVGKVIWH